MVRLTTPTKLQPQPKALWAGMDGRARSRASGCILRNHAWRGEGVNYQRSTSLRPCIATLPFTDNKVRAYTFRVRALAPSNRALSASPRLASRPRLAQLRLPVPPTGARALQAKGSPCVSCGRRWGGERSGSIDSCSRLSVF
jgi:hypothetical protein